MSQDLGTVVYYRKCGGCRREYHQDDIVAEGTWQLLGQSCAGEACLRCGARLESKQRTVYPRVKDVSEFEVGGVYFSEDSSHDLAPHERQRFQVLAGPEEMKYFGVARTCLLVRTVNETGELGSQAWLWPVAKFGVQEPGGGRRVNVTTYRVR